jgi:hypothetical protein
VVTAEPAGCRDALERIRRDFQGVSESLSSIAFVYTTDTGSVGETGARTGDDDASVDGGWPPGSLLVRTPTRTFLVEYDSEAELVASVADVLVDEVMDDVGHPWPQLTVSDRSTSMTPLVIDGEAVWGGGNTAVCLIGELTEHRD